ncbi:esterase-like activity of phytase family protein [Tepidicaulis sp. LMO-SS28]|uniref:esterase-like activity of phytase family protein n=1 Tax=Tepidicaulis sp. LMO-SS28 TaxID=3447455 RepID=UPI003EE3771A
MTEPDPAKARKKARHTSFILGALGLALLLYGLFSFLQADAELPGAAQIDVSASPVLWNLDNWEEQETGALRFVAGLELTSAEPAFGGLSGLHISSDGKRLLSVSDQGDWLSADLVHDGIKIAGLENARMAPLLGPDGKPLASKYEQDAEGLDVTKDGFACVSFERHHRVWCYELSRLGFEAPAIPISIGDAAAGLEDNGGFESLVILERDGAGPRLLLIAESPRGAAGTLPAAEIGKEGIRHFSLKEEPPFSPTDAALRSNGNLIVSERRYSPLAGVGLRIREIEAGFLEADAPLEGRELLNAGQTYSIDNMEGLALVETEEGRTFLFLLSDDNFNSLQRTLLLQFEFRQ